MTVPILTARRRSGAHPGGLPVDLLRGSLVLALGVMLIAKVANGTVAYYIKTDLVWGVLLAAVGLLVIGLAHLLRWAVVRPAAGGWSATLAEAALLVPLVAGLVLPARPLDSAALEQRGLNTLGVLGRPADQRLAALQADTSQWTLLDWSIALHQEADPGRLQGQPVRVVGFVYTKDRTLQPGEFSLVRFVVTCCAADGSAVGLPVRWAQNSTLTADSWLQVDGTLEVARAPGGEPRPVIVASQVQPIEAPRTPYLYP